MIIEILNADTAVPEINVKDIDDCDSLDKLRCIVQLFEYQTQYWDINKRYAPTIEALIEDLDPKAYRFLQDTLVRAKKYWKMNGSYPVDIEDLKGWEEIN